MIKKLLIGTIIIVAVVGVIVLLTGKKTQEPAQEPASVNNNSGSEQTSEESIVTTSTIEATTSGFTPSVVNIKAGEMVVWKNKSGSSISINSDYHPHHNLYPSLNIAEVPDGSSVSFIFYTPGGYKYHNNFIPSQRGTVIVE